VSVTPSVAPQGSEPTPGHAIDDPWLPAASRIVLRKPKGNRRVEPERQRPTAKQLVASCGRALRRATPVLVGAALVAAFGAAAALSHRWVTSSPRFAIAAITLSGNQGISTESLLAQLPVRPGDNMFAAETSALERALTANPWIASAEVHRELPHTLAITVRERKAVALVDLGGLYLVDASGAPFKRAAVEFGEGQGLPAITGIERLAFRADPAATQSLIRAALTAMARWQASPRRPPLAELAFDVYRGLTLRTQRPSVAVHLGALDDPALPERMALFEAAWAHLGPDEQSRAEAMFLDGGPGQATIAFAKN
jgi:cell division protein FtsQ